MQKKAGNTGPHTERHTSTNTRTAGDSTTQKCTHIGGRHVRSMDAGFASVRTDSHSGRQRHAHGHRETHLSCGVGGTTRSHEKPHMYSI